MLARRIQAHLPIVIKPNEMGFVMGRSILNNIFLTQESLEWTTKSGHHLVFLLLNFENTFDKKKLS
jgi:hypothetical protein